MNADARFVVEPVAVGLGSVAPQFVCGCGFDDVLIRAGNTLAV